jgi:hypothetical protein
MIILLKKTVKELKNHPGWLQTVFCKSTISQEFGIFSQWYKTRVVAGAIKYRMVFSAPELRWEIPVLLRIFWFSGITQS